MTLRKGEKVELLHGSEFKQVAESAWLAEGRDSRFTGKSKQLARLLAATIVCPCGCGSLPAQLEPGGNCYVQSVGAKFFCGADVNINAFDDDGTWDAGIILV